MQRSTHGAPLCIHQQNAKRVSKHKKVIEIMVVESPPAFKSKIEDVEYHSHETMVDMNFGCERKSYLFVDAFATKNVMIETSTLKAQSLEKRKLRRECLELKPRRRF